MKSIFKNVAVIAIVAILAFGMMGCPNINATVDGPDYSKCEAGDFILKDGTILSKDKTPTSGTVAAVIVRAASEDKPALGVGIFQDQACTGWCTTGRYQDTKIEALVADYSGKGYDDGSDGWEKLAAITDAKENPNFYPAWNYCLNYGKAQNFTGELATGWYLPTIAEFMTMNTKKQDINASLEKVGGNQLIGACWTCNQSDNMYTNNKAWAVVFYSTDGSCSATDVAKQSSGYRVFAVRAFK